MSGIIDKQQRTAAVDAVLQLDSPDCFGIGNTIIESCKIRTLYTPQDPSTAQWISEALGPKTEVHQQTTYTGHRLAFWLGHIMVADQESARPLLDAAEVCKLPAHECIVLVQDSRLFGCNVCGTTRTRLLLSAHRSLP